MCLQRTLERFIRNKRGSVSMMAGLTIPVLATAVMASVEFNSVVADKEKMQRRADATALFAANNKELLEGNTSSDLQTTTHERILNSVAASGMDISHVQSDYVYDATRDRVVGEVTFSPNPKFLGSFFLPETITVVTEAAPLKPKKLEISLVLDLSGSMNWSPSSDARENAPVGSRRVDALRAGVHTLVNELDGEENVEAKFAVVPYATSVDLTDLAVNGAAHMSEYYQDAAGGALPNICARQDFGGNVPSNCLNHITNGRFADNPAGPSQQGLWAAERYASRAGSTFNLSLASPSISRVPVVTQYNRRIVSCRDRYISQIGYRCPEFANDIHGTPLFEPRDFKASSILSMTDNAQDVRDYVDGLEARGGTAGHIGTAWGLYSLAPEWAPVFNSPTGEPAAFDDIESHKIMVVMTDGDFTSTQDPSMDDQDAYGYFQAACALAREQGVEIYTVGLRASENTDTQLTQCAGSSARYFSVDNRNALIRAFERISDSATQVRLSS